MVVYELCKNQYSLGDVYVICYIKTRLKDYTRGSSDWITTKKNLVNLSLSLSFLSFYPAFSSPPILHISRYYLAFLRKTHTYTPRRVTKGIYDKYHNSNEEKSSGRKTTTRSKQSFVFYSWFCCYHYLLVGCNYI